MGFYLTWQQNGTVIRGFDGAQEVNGSLFMPISFPGSIGMQQAITLSTSALQDGTFDTLQGVKLYLTGDPDDVNTVQMIWPYLNNQRQDLNGGLEISFDNWVSVTRFDKYNGNFADPSTWIVLPAKSIGLYGIDGTLGAFDTAHIMIRYTVPPGADQNQVMNIWLEADFDVV